MLGQTIVARWLGNEAMKSVFTILISVTMLASVNCWGQQTPAQQCLLDLDAIPGFLLDNDTGAQAHLAQFGQRHFDDALAEAKEAAAQVSDAAACEQVLQRYLKAWRKGHLAVKSVAPERAASDQASTPNQRDNAPRLRSLSQHTLLLTLKSFANTQRAALIALLSQHRKELASHPNWIVDVRGNGGGSDSSYEPLLPWLLSDETVTAGAEWLATPANIRGQEEACARFAPGDAQCEAYTRQAVARMRSVASGTYVAQDDSGDLKFEPVKQRERQRPSRVAVIIDGRCGSSCEEFVLVARQSFSVKVIGRPSFGSLDYSNLRPYDLPSGKRVLWYATSRSLRLPGYAVDVAGIAPDIYLPLPDNDRAGENEVERVRQWLEGGSLAPAGSPAAQRGHARN
jgi:Peptidase family S41